MGSGLRVEVRFRVEEGFRVEDRFRVEVKVEVRFRVEVQLWARDCVLLIFIRYSHFHSGFETEPSLMPFPLLWNHGILHRRSLTHCCSIASCRCVATPPLHSIDSNQ